MEHFTLTTTTNRPLCKRCGTRMMLARISPDNPSFENFECPKCSNVEVERVATDPLEACKGWVSAKELEPPN